MSRLATWGNRSRRGSRAPTEYASIGDNHVSDALIEIRALQQRAMTVMTSYTPTREDTLRMLFPADTIAKAQAAKGIVEPHTSSMSYDLSKDAVVTIDYEGCHTPTIEPAAMQLQPNFAAPLLSLVHEARIIHEQYEDVKALLRWFNRNATPGAIRYYWPPILKLCPKAPAFVNLQDVPTRHTTPKNISKLMQLVRDTATTMAGAMLISRDVAMRQRDKLRLTFRSVDVQRGEHEYETDSVTYNY